jgi:hypothetical protein
VSSVPSFPKRFAPASEALADAQGAARHDQAAAPVGLVLFEVLHLAFVLPRFFNRRKGTEVAALARLLVLLPRVQAKLSGFEFANHINFNARAFSSVDAAQTCGWITFIHVVKIKSTYDFEACAKSNGLIRRCIRVCQ